jgi:hypothetical protein
VIVGLIVCLPPLESRSLDVGCDLSDPAEYLVVFGEPSAVVLAPNLSAVHVYVKHPAPTFYQTRLDFEFVLDRFRQTGGPRIVVSFYTVLDADFHCPRFLSH